MTLNIKSLSCGYDKKAITFDLNLNLNGGELLVLAGPNGSGKTSILKTIGGLIPPIDGSIEIGGRNIRGMKTVQRAGLISFLFQAKESPWPFTVKETISQGRFYNRGWFGSDTANDRKTVERAIEKANLEKLSHRLITELSGGELQRVLLARCIAQDTKFLLLDEPVNNLDPKYSYMIMDLISDLAKEGRGIILSLHDLRLASGFATEIALLSAEGKIAAMGSPSDVLSSENIGSVYEIPEDLAKLLIL